MFDSNEVAAPDALMIVDTSLGGVDDEVVELLAASQDDSEDDETDEVSAITDLAICDLL